MRKAGAGGARMVYSWLTKKAIGIVDEWVTNLGAVAVLGPKEKPPEARP